MNETIITAEPGKQDVFITRTFDAARELVFGAYTEPELLEEWLGPKMKVERFDARSGGAWMFILTDAQGNAHGFHGFFHEVVAPTRFIRTFEFDGLPERGHVGLETVKLEALGPERTLVTTQYVLQSCADRDGMVAAGMKPSMNESHERLSAFLARRMERKR